MGRKKHNKNQQKGSENDANQNKSAENDPRSSSNQSTPTKSQKSDNMAKSTNSQKPQSNIVDQVKEMSISTDKQQSERMQQQMRSKEPSTSNVPKKVPDQQNPQNARQQPEQRGPNQPQKQGGVQKPRSIENKKQKASNQRERVCERQSDQKKQPQKQYEEQQPSTSKDSKKEINQRANTQTTCRQPKQQNQEQRQKHPGEQQSSKSKDSNKSQKVPPTKSSSEQLNVAETSMPHLMCPYKGPGTRGIKFRSLLETNYLRLIINKMKDYAYHYDVTMQPDKPKKYMSKIFQQFCQNNFPGKGIAFDGSRNAYAPEILELGESNREVDFVHPETGDVRKYLVTIKETEDMKIPLNILRSYQTMRQYDMPKRALQCIEIVLKGAYQQSHLNMGIQAARSFYLPPQKREYLGDFFELWLGLFQSTVLGSQIYLNVDVAHKAFPKRYASLLDLLQDIQYECRCDQRMAIEHMRKHLAGLDVIYKTPVNAGNKRIYKFMGLVGTPREERFTDMNGRQITVADYFREHNYPIARPDLPCVKLGNTIKSITVPMEHCSLSDRQAINKKCTENQTRSIIKFAATSTDVRKRKIMELLGNMKYNQSPIIRGFGLEVDTNFAKVQARCLEAPKIQYAGNKLVEVRNGVWRGEGMPFLIPESANKWAILNANPRTKNNELTDLAKTLIDISRPTNLNLAETPTFIRSVDNRNFANIQRELENAKRDGIRILFCVIPDSGPTYAKIKQLAETRVGVLTQCIKGGTVFRKRCDGSTISNILLKCNAKLNGTNHRLNNSPILYEKCMLIGADVTHPSPDQKHIPSVVGVAASHDVNAFSYNVCWRLQEPRVEIILDFKQIMIEHLEFYRRKNNFLPNKILYYRDGVSEGQFQQVMANEKMAISMACVQVEPGYERRVKITIIVVQKRHHTRFFPGTTEIGKNDHRNNNVPAGTIVDTEITHPQENHFYLVSHQSIQGVAKPTKYCILLDEANHSIDDLQGLSYNLCHLFSRCNRSVSYPAPTYYAHLAAYRGRVYIENERLNMNNLQNEWRNRAIRDDIAKTHPMFFV